VIVSHTSDEAFSNRVSKTVILSVTSSVLRVLQIILKQKTEVAFGTSTTEVTATHDRHLGIQLCKIILSR
jgi:valyl-tRNA synthetase